MNSNQPIYSWDGKSILVAGASRGIGKEVAIQFGTSGSKVFLLARDIKELQKTQEIIQSQGGQAYCVQTDLLSSQSIDEAIKWIETETSSIDILVNAVGGFSKFLEFEKIDENEWNHVMHLNVTTAFMLTQKSLSLIKLARHGRIIHVGSIAGLGPNSHAKSYMPYGVAKSALMTMVKYLAKELGQYGITVNCVSPGTTATERVKNIRGQEGLEMIAKLNPLQHFLEPKDTVQAILFLASDHAGAITGINLNVNAGSVI